MDRQTESTLVHWTGGLIKRAPIPLDRHAPAAQRAKAYKLALRQAGFQVRIRSERGRVAIHPDYPEAVHACHRPDYQPWTGERCPACLAQQALREQIESVLAAQFPTHRDRSEIETDYFDFVYLVH